MPNLLLKVSQSAEPNSPLTPLAEVGMLITKALPVPKVEVVMLKSLPVVPVATLLTKLTGRLITKELVEVEMLKTLPPVVVDTVAMTLAKGKEATLRFLLASVTTREDAVRVAMLMLPRLEMLKTVEPEEEATLKIVVLVLVAAATTKAAAGVVVLMPMLLLARTVKIVALEDEATLKIGKDWAVVEPWTTKVAVGVVELTANCWAVLNQRKLAEEAVVLAPVA